MGGGGGTSENMVTNPSGLGSIIPLAAMLIAVEGFSESNPMPVSGPAPEIEMSSSRFPKKGL